MYKKNCEMKKDLVNLENDTDEISKTLAMEKSKSFDLKKSLCEANSTLKHEQTIKSNLKRPLQQEKAKNTELLTM